MVFKKVNLILLFLSILAHCEQNLYSCKKNFPNLLALLLFGFLLGNVFGTFLNTFKGFFLSGMYLLYLF